MDLKKLAEPFPPEDIEWRLAQSGLKSNGEIWAKCLAYVTARAVMDRLDAVCGPENWRVSYSLMQSPTPSIMASLGVRIGGEWIEKSDGAEQTEIENVKGGISSALKRSAVTWGIGRYLYRLEDGFARIVERNENGAYYAKTKEGKPFYWIPPNLPDWAVPTIQRTPPKTPNEVKAEKLSDALPEKNPYDFAEETQFITKPTPTVVKIAPKLPDLTYGELRDPEGLGQYEIKCGSPEMKGKRLMEFGQRDLANRAMALRVWFKEKGKVPTGDWLKFLEKADQYAGLAPKNTAS